MVASLRLFFSRPGRNSSRVWLVGLTLVAGVHVVWELLNQTPPVWDMAYHQLQGWQYLEAWREGRLWRDFAKLSTYYPPLYYLQEAVVLAWLPRTQFLALLTNLTGLALLTYSSCRIASRFAPPNQAALAGLVPAMLPMVAWTTRESLLDVSLSGWVAAAVCLISEPAWLSRRRWVFLVGLILAAGMLTKWTFVVFMAGPVCFLLATSRQKTAFAWRLLVAGAVASPAVMLWYYPNLAALAERFRLTSQTGTNFEGDPGLGSLLSWIYYPRCLSSYYLYLPLTLLFLVGLAANLRKMGRGSGYGLLWSWLVGGTFLLTLIDAKDPRYVMPLAAPAAILLVRFWNARGPWMIVATGVAALQFLTVSFDLWGRPIKAAWFDIPNDADYRGMRQEWVFYQSEYFGVTGPPRREDWRLEELAKATEQADRVGFVADSPRFHPGGLQLAALRNGRRLTVVRLGQTADSPQWLPTLPFVIGKTGPQGISYITQFNADVYRKLEELRWPEERRWPLPDGSEAILWRNPTTPSQSR